MVKAYILVETGDPKSLAWTQSFCGHVKKPKMKVDNDSSKYLEGDPPVNLMLEVGKEKESKSKEEDVPDVSDAY